MLWPLILFKATLTRLLLLYLDKHSQMKKLSPLIPLFKQFIKDTETGKRLKKNGERIKPQSIQNYYYVMNNLVQFSVDCKIELRVADASKLNKRELLSEKNYWKKFYLKFTEFLYKKGCFNN